MTTLYKYALTCSNEATTKYVWRDETDATPTKCPDDSSHTIIASSVRIVDKREQNTVVVKEESTPTGGNFRTESVPFDIPAGTTHTEDKSWNYNVSVLDVFYISTSDHIGDTLEIIVAPNTTIGIITGNVDIGTTTINVSQTVVDNTMIGYYINLTDGVNNDSLGEVIDIDKDNLTITCSIPTTNSFSASSPTYVVQNIYMLRDFEIGPPFHIVIGECKIGGSSIPAGITVRVNYKNNGIVSKRFVPYIEYLY